MSSFYLFTVMTNNTNKWIFLILFQAPMINIQANQGKGDLSENFFGNIILTSKPLQLKTQSIRSQWKLCTLAGILYLLTFPTSDISLGFIWACRQSSNVTLGDEGIARLRSWKPFVCSDSFWQLEHFVLCVIQPEKVDLTSLTSFSNSAKKHLRNSEGSCCPRCSSGKVWMIFRSRWWEADVWGDSQDCLISWA